MTGSILPLWLTLDAPSIRDDARLSPDKMSVLGGDAKVIEQINRRGEEMGAFVVGRLQTLAFDLGLIGSINDDLTTILSPIQKQNAITATKMLSVAALYGVTPGDTYQNAAKSLSDGRGEAVIGYSRLGSALSIVESLENGLRILASRKSGKASGAEAIEVVRALQV